MARSPDRRLGGCEVISGVDYYGEAGCALGGSAIVLARAKNPAYGAPLPDTEVFKGKRLYQFDGYTLDKEMSDAELSFRSEDEYLSAYRRVLDFFDAVKIGLCQSLRRWHEPVERMADRGLGRSGCAADDPEDG